MMKSVVVVLCCVTAVWGRGGPPHNEDFVPPGWKNLPDHVWNNIPNHVKEKFLDGKFVHSNFEDFQLQSVTDNGGEIITRCGGGTTINVDMSDTGAYEQTSVLADGVVCMKDGDHADHSCPIPRTHVMELVLDSGDEVTVTLTKDSNDGIKTIQVTSLGCSETFQQVIPGIVTSIPKEAYDEDLFQSTFKYGEAPRIVDGDHPNIFNHDQVAPPDDAQRERRSILRRNLRANVIMDIEEQQDLVEGDVGEASNNGRHLEPISCSTVRELRLAVAFESSFCAAFGADFDEAVQEVIEVVTEVRAVYKTDTCLRVKLVYVEGYCNPDFDPYKEAVELNLSGCGNNGLLNGFQDYWNNNRDEVDSLYDIDSVQLLSGTGLECSGNSCVIGCAYIGVLCFSGAKYGVNYLNFSSNQDRRVALLAHELGHNAGANHVSDSTKNYIMEGSVNNGSDGFSAASQTSFGGNQNNCLASAPNPAPAPPSTPAPFVLVEGTSEPEPTQLPTSPPTKSPTPLPTQPPSPSPTPLPTALPSSLPTTPPTSSPTKAPSPSPTPLPTASPSSLPTTPPTPSPTQAPSSSPTPLPTAFPTSLPTQNPTIEPTPIPTTPTSTPQPTQIPTNPPSPLPTNLPTMSPSSLPTMNPTPAPSLTPTSLPTTNPTNGPTPVPTTSPTSEPTSSPSYAPTNNPTSSPTPAPTQPSSDTWEEVTFDGFESGWGNWNDGGQDVRRKSRDKPYCNNGSTYCIRLRNDYTGHRGENHMTSDPYNAGGTYDKFRISFYYRVRKFEINDSFQVRYSIDNGYSWNLIYEYVTDRYIETGNIEFIEDLETPTLDLDSSILFRIEGGAVGKWDLTYIDDVKVEGRIHSP